MTYISCEASDGARCILPAMKLMTPGRVIQCGRPGCSLDWMYNNATRSWMLTITTGELDAVIDADEIKAGTLTGEQLMRSPSVEMTHQYLSTACLHGLHDQCRRVCKFCSVGCQCTECEHKGVQE